MAVDTEINTFSKNMGDSVGLVTQKLDTWFSDAISLIPNLIVALIVFFIFFLIARIVKKIVVSKAEVLNRPGLGNLLGGLFKTVVMVAGFLIAATIVLPSLNPGSLISGLGIGSVAIGFAFKDILQNWLAGLLILLRQPFEPGDVIVVNSHEGVVEAVETRATVLKTFDGQRIIIPNSQIYTTALLVRTAYPVRRSQFEVGIGYGDDVVKASNLILKTVASIKGVETSPAPDISTVDLAASWVTLRVRWWVDSRDSSIYAVQSEALTAIKTTLDANGIDMPFNTVVNLFHNQTEINDGVRGAQREGWPKA
jgi:small-conductance mechanosensitive channel